MMSKLLRLALATTLLTGGVYAQSEKAAPKQEPAAAAKAAPKLEKKEKIRVLKPEEVPGELVRLESKADIKAELKIKTIAGRPLVFKGVIRNGKLIERIVDRRFIQQKDVSHKRCGVRLWWSGNSDGYIFFRYSNIETLTITGKLTAKERAEILRRLRAAKEGEVDAEAEAARKKAEAAQKLPDLEKLTVAEREKWLMARFNAAKGWTSHRYRDLKRKQVLEDKELSAEEAVFVKYFSALERARFRALRAQPTKKEKFAPRSGEKQPEQPGNDEQPEEPKADEPTEEES